MPTIRRLSFAFALTACLALLILSPPESAGADGAGPRRVTVVTTPDGGIQPQAVTDARGTVHLVYFKGEPAGGDLYYARLGPGDEIFLRPMWINSQDGSAIAMGTIRGAQIATGKNGRVQVAWGHRVEELPHFPGSRDVTCLGHMDLVPDPRGAPLVAEGQYLPRWLSNGQRGT